MQYKINKEKNSQIEIEVTFAKQEFLAKWDAGFKALQAEVELDGFRKGHAPENAIIAKYGDTAIINEIANILINESYPKIVMDEAKNNNVKVIADPHIHIVKASKEDDFVYHAHVLVYPEITLPDYKKVIAEANIVKNIINDSSEEEVKSVLEKLDADIIKNTPDIENKIKENLKLEKEMHEISRVRNAALETLIKKTDAINTDAWPEGWSEKDKAQIIILEIAKKEDIKVTEEEIETEKIKMMMHINPSDLESGKIDEVRVKNYAEQIILNEKVLSFLIK
jgi:FKBP-type peptidyl-prolyl cis-trans isomerase (trigger factor)